MNAKRNETDWTSRYGWTILTLLAICGFLIPQTALATPGGTQISNTATVTYDDSVGTPQTPEVSTTTTTVNMVPASPTLTFVEFDSTPGSTAAVTANETTAVLINYRLTSNSNGTDTYEFVPAPSSVNAGVGVPILPAQGNITLGASMTAIGTTIPANTTTVVYLVPDGTDDSINFNIAVTDEVVVGGEIRTVTAIDETNAAYAMVTLGAALTGAPAQGTNVYESDVFTYTVTTGTLTGPPVAGSHQVTVVTRSTTDTLLTATQSPDPATINVVRTAMTVTKYVRNVDTGIAGGGTTATIGADTYYTTGVTGDPTDVLEYLIVINNSGSGVAQNIVVSDPISPYVTLNAASIQLDPGTGAFGAVNTTVDDGDAAELDGATNTIYVYAGTGGTDTLAGAGNGTGGSLNAAQVSRVLLQVTIN